MDLIGSTLFSGARSAVLGLLYGHPDEAFYLRQIVDTTGLGIGQVQRETAQLSAAGILQRQSRGRHVYFQADPACPIFEELRGIVTKTSGGAGVLLQSLAPLQDRVTTAFIYGSVARGEERRTSDLDLLVVGDVTFGEVADAIRSAESRLHRTINPTVYSTREFRDKLLRGHPFLKRVVEGRKVFVLGGEHELGSLPAQRVDTPARTRRRRYRPTPGHR